MKKKKNSGKGIRILLTMIIIAAVCVLGFSTYKLLGISASYQEANDLYEDVGNLFETRNNAEESDTPAELPSVKQSVSNTWQTADAFTDTYANPALMEELTAASNLTEETPSVSDHAGEPAVYPGSAEEMPSLLDATEETRLYSHTAEEAPSYPDTAEETPEYTDDSELSLEETETTQEETSPEPQTPAVPPRYASLQWDYGKLLSVCEDGIGYIYQEGTPVSYPIVQAEDNDKYLRHMINGEYNVAGSIFVDSNFPDGLNGRYSFIYGHNMDDKSMFGSITAYKNEEYYQEHPEFEIYIGEDCYVYYVFSAYQAAVDDFIFTYDFESDEEFVEKMQEARDLCSYETTAPEITKDSIVTFLSTCIDYPRDYHYRFVVFLVRGEQLVNDEHRSSISYAEYPWNVFDRSSETFLKMLQDAVENRYWDLFLGAQGYAPYERNGSVIRVLRP